MVYTGNPIDRVSNTDRLINDLFEEREDVDRVRGQFQNSPSGISYHTDKKEIIRRSELMTLRIKAATQRGSIVVLTGRSGTGKTEAATHALGPDALVCLGELENGSPGTTVLERIDLSLYPNGVILEETHRVAKEQLQLFMKRATFSEVPLVVIFQLESEARTMVSNWADVEWLSLD